MNANSNRKRASRSRLSQQTLSCGYLALVRSSETEALLADYKAFSLLAYIALRARYSGSTARGLARGQMHMGRHSAGRDLGMTQGETREATKRLKAANHIAVKATNNGSVVTLISRSVFDITDDASNQRNSESPASQQPANNQLTATNEEGIWKNGRKCEGAEPPPPTHTHLPSWFSEVAARHPTKDADACWPVYLDNCERKNLPPSKISFDDWLGCERKRLKPAPKLEPMAEQIDAGPPSWLDWLKSNMPEKDDPAYDQLLSVCGVRRFSALPPSWQRRCRMALETTTTTLGS